MNAYSKWRIRPTLLGLATVTSLTFTSAATAQDHVDIAIVLAADISGSMDEDTEQVWQRRGYAAAFRDAEVIRAITEGEYGRIAVTYAEWGGYNYFDVVLPWQVIDSRSAALAFADDLEATPLLVGYDATTKQTSIVGAIKNSTRLLRAMPYAAERMVIDVSGDGANNQPSPNHSGFPSLAEVRQRAIDFGITINALPIDSGGGRQFRALDSDGFAYETDIVSYYSKRVMGGPGSFVIPAMGWRAFPEAIKRKLWREIFVADIGAPSIASEFLVFRVGS